MRATSLLSRDSSTRAKTTETGADQAAQTTNKQDIYTRVTNAIISAIDAGAGQYRMPWVVRQDRGFSPISVSTVKPYRGVNTLVLSYPITP
jgi:antirestriction protein ArdC